MARGAGELREQVRAPSDRYRMLRACDRVWVAVSGGPDSLSLLNVQRSLAAELDIELAVAHFNHKLRGESSDQDEAYVRELCSDWGVACFVGCEEVAARASREGLSLEEAGRGARYEYFSALAAEHDFSRVALGHTATDRVETVLINILRGSGLHGLRGIPPVRGIFIRPLIAARREATIEYCRHHHLEPRWDETNLEVSEFLRNKVRLELLPLLAEEYADAPAESLLRLARAAEEELEWTEPLVTAAFGEVARTDAEKVSLDREKLAEMPAGLLYRVLRRALVALRGAATDVGSIHYDELRRLVEAGQTGAELHLPGNILARTGYTDIDLILDRGAPAGDEVGEEGYCELAVPGVAEGAGSGKTVAAEVVSESPGELGDAAESLIIVDADAVELPLAVRNWRPGDAFQPLGMSGHKKVQDLFVDEKVPRRQRRGVPVVVDGRDRIVWVVGLRMAEQFRVTDATVRFLKLSATAAR